MTPLIDWAPLAAAVVAIVAAANAWHSSRKKPQLDAVSIDKVRAEINKESAAANARRDRHLLRMENWGFEKVIPWSRRAVTVIDDQNSLLVELAARASIPYTPHVLEPLPEMPQIDD
ncbi:MAG: hypothetical protein ACSLE6_07405 [Mycobacterium sp.]